MMKKVSNFFWLKQMVIQIALYISLYELLKLINIVDFNLHLGITSRYLFYLYVILSFILGFIILFTKRCNIYYILSFILIFVIISVFDFLSAPKLISLIWVISFISILVTYYLNHELDKRRFAPKV